ncbi:cytochrome b [Tropicibacter naphthalenivorans]|uniref:Cytochrome b-562 n=1 Tax=Tropicibacter naphthalenivorans TaxID=441103 RepID=A0A0P1G059_9RHOB|nr:cytochrome b [Tropicibacter naphthalenivorans]CUH74871.1 Cytochrome b-562 [Tropicibacter naphthalenivorans]SMC48588.1 cytochrome b561 [Tropicibacter naphthalenivorans]
MTQPARYAPVQIALHWLIAVLFAFNFIVSDGMGQALRAKLSGAEPEGLVALLHPPVGIALLVLTLIRVVVRQRMGAPALPQNNNPLMDKVAHAVHWALYVLLVLIPVSGMAAWGVGIRAAGEVHEVVVGLTIWLVGLHVIAALFHQFVLKDGLMLRMRPGPDKRRSDVV